MKYLTPTLLIVIVLAGLMSCKHNPVAPKGKDTCDTCQIDTSHHPCDTCDTSHHTNSNDTTSHNFVWSEKSLSGEAGLSGCWVFGTNNIYAVGGAVWKWNGVQWKDVSPIGPHGSLSGDLSGYTMFAFSDTDYWLTHWGLMYHCTGSNAERIQIDSFSFGNLHSSWGTSSKDMYSVGDGGTILHFDGTSWTRMQSGTTTRLSSIWGTTDKNIWACGYDQTTGKTILLRYNGSTWSEDALSVSKGIDAVGGFDVVWSCDSAGHSVAVTSGSIIVKKTDAGGWRSDSGLTPNLLSGGNGFVGLYCLSGNTINDYFASGGWGWVGHWNGASWKLYDQFYHYGTSDYFSNAVSQKDNTVCVVGEKSGGAWVAIGQR